MAKDAAPAGPVWRRETVLWMVWTVLCPMWTLLPPWATSTSNVPVVPPTTTLSPPAPVRTAVGTLGVLSTYSRLPPLASPGPPWTSS